MQVTFSSTLTKDSGTLIFLCFKGKKLDDYLLEINKKNDNYLDKAIKISGLEFNGKSCTEIILPQGSKADRILLLGLQELKEFDSSTKLERLGSFITAELNKRKIKEASLVINTNHIREGMEAHIIFGANLNTYRFNKYFSDKNNMRHNYLLNLNVISKNSTLLKKHWSRLGSVKEGVFLTRDLVSEPSNNLTPVLLAKAASKLKSYGIKVNILDEKKLKDLKMGALLGVAQGSSNKPFVVTLEWKGDKKSNETDFAFVGKGVTFDTGGISIKPSGGMEEMKYDMGGSAVVIGLMKALALSKSKSNVTGIVGLVENMPSGTAQRPGDVVKSMSGQTIEVINTDAEGRLVLADIVWYAQKKYKPKKLIDLATLTGAIIVSIGQEKAGMFSNDKSLANSLEKIGKQIGEPVWNMPIDDSYEKDIKSDIADMKNVGSGRGAGSTAGAIFVKRFIKNTSWIHLDIAGVTWTKSDKPLIPKGGTGFGVRLLEQLVFNNKA
jgi:leucyl aminopeptidase